MAHLPGRDSSNENILLRAGRAAVAAADAVKVDDWFAMSLSSFFNHKQINLFCRLYYFPRLFEVK